MSSTEGNIQEGAGIVEKLKVILLSATGSGMSIVGQAVRHIENEYPGQLTLQARTNDDLFDTKMVERFIKDHIMTADCVIAILHGGRRSLRGFNEIMKASGNAYIHLHPSDEDSIELSSELSSEYGSDYFDLITQYIKSGGVENWTNLLKSLMVKLRNAQISYQQPKPMPSEGIYHPETGANESLTEYLTRRGTSPEELEASKSPVVAVWFYQGYYVDGNLAYVDALIEEIENQGGFPVACFLTRYMDNVLKNKGPDWVIENYLQVDGKTIIHALINTLVFSMKLSTPQFSDVYERLGVPVLQGITLFSTTRKYWKGSVQGVTPMDVSISAAQPEFDGSLITVPIATKELEQGDPLTGVTILKYEPIEERVKKLVELTIKWSLLAIKPNEDKKVAIIFHNYPPRNDRIGCAAGLDSFASVVGLLERLKAEGYIIDREYGSGDELAEEILERVTIDRRWLTPDKMAARAVDLIGEDHYEEWHDNLPEKNRDHMIRDWGDIPGEIFTCRPLAAPNPDFPTQNLYDKKVMVNGIINGNIYIGIQPPRGFIDQPEKIHDPYLAPGHHYIFHYRWIRDVFKADAIMHVGKHGSLEWLPGKSLGLSEECYPDLSIMDLPNIYPYIINDPGEGTQAKRRSYACIIDHLIPVMTNAGHYEELAEVDTKLVEYVQTKSMNPNRLPVIQKEIWEATVRHNLHTDIEVTEEEAFSDFDAFMEKLHSYLSEVTTTAISDGLHTLGVSPQDNQLVEFTTQLVRLKNGDIPSLPESIAQEWGYDYDELLDQRGKPDPSGRFPTNASVIDAIYEESMNLVRHAIENGKTNEDNQKYVRITEFINDTVLFKLHRTTEEMESSISALSGCHVLPGPSGSPTRGMVEILPTGRNFFSVDPYKIPSSTAWITGMSLGDELVERHKKETGLPPDNIGMVIWGSPTMRNMGEDIAEALYLMGIKPVWNEKNARVEGLEIIPIDELKFPRIDVTFRTSGFFRDSFPNLMELMDEAVNIVAALNEPVETNFLKKNIMLEVEELTARGIDPAKALRDATFRVFSDAPGTYGAGVPEAIDAKVWEKAEDLGDIYINWGGYAYAKNTYGAERKESFRRRLGKMRLVVKNEDSREYDMLSSDDFNAYFGGYVAAVKAVTGNYPLAYSGDASDPDRVKYRSIQEEAKHVFRSRILNPKWIEGLMRHGYKGAGDLSRAVDVSFHWDATSNVIDDWMYEGLAQKYAFDERMKQWLKEVNPYALQNITERLIEAINRGMWDASDEMQENLQSLYFEIEGDIEEITD
jgi:cobaltochelatase CobN